MSVENLVPESKHLISSLLSSVICGSSQKMIRLLTQLLKGKLVLQLLSGLPVPSGKNESTKEAMSVLLPLLAGPQTHTQFFFCVFQFATLRRHHPKNLYCLVDHPWNSQRNRLILLTVVASLRVWIGCSSGVYGLNGSVLICIAT